MRSRLEQVFGVVWGESLWFSTYRVQHRVASAFRQGPFFLAGDAAHVHSPVGAQGMNTGLQDAHNLALKIVDVIQGRTPDASLDRYEAERRPVAQRLVRTTDRAFGIVTSDLPGSRLVRRWAIPLFATVAARFIPRLGGASRLFEYISQVRIHYWMSDEEKKQARGKRHAVIGRRLPWTGDNFDCLRDARWQVHGYGDVSPDAAARLEAELGIPVRLFPYAVHERLDVGAFYLVRPDGFVAAQAWPNAAVGVFRKWLPGLGASP